jgi:hypothetical protein
MLLLVPVHPCFDGGDYHVVRRRRFVISLFALREPVHRQLDFLMRIAGAQLLDDNLREGLFVLCEPLMRSAASLLLDDNLLNVLFQDTVRRNHHDVGLVQPLHGFVQPLYG